MVWCAHLCAQQISVQHAVPLFGRMDSRPPLPGASPILSPAPTAKFGAPAIRRCRPWPSTLPRLNKAKQHTADERTHLPSGACRAGSRACPSSGSPSASDSPSRLGCAAKGSAGWGPSGGGCRCDTACSMGTSPNFLLRGRREGDRGYDQTQVKKGKRVKRASREMSWQGWRSKATRRRVSLAWDISVKPPTASCSSWPFKSS